MDQLSNIILTVMFSAIAVWLFYGYSKTRNLIYKDKLWSMTRIFFLIAGLFCILSALVYTSALDWIRLAAMLLCVVAFFLVRDGIGEDGFGVMGRFYPFEKVRAYDYGDYKKDQFKVFFIPEGDETPVSVALLNSQKDEILAFLKSKIGKKYTRMKKG